MKATLVLETGKSWEGESFGYEGNTGGEVVFNTGMIGYPETLTDPSYRGQILTLTYPLVGNYGIPDFEARDFFWLKKYFESDQIHVSWLIVSEYAKHFSHYEAHESLADFLIAQKIPAIEGIDTRAVTEYIREHGAVPWKILLEHIPDSIHFSDPNERLLAYEVSISEPILYHSPAPIGKTLLVVDMGIKNNMLRIFLSLGLDIIRVPWDFPFTRKDLEYDGIFISNGPGDPAKYLPTIQEIQKAITMKKPIFGICLGNQLLALASGAKTYKLPYGHRGQNQPVKDIRSNRCILTSQNHSFAIDESTLPEHVAPWMQNMNDGTNEGIYFRDTNIASVQFHPEATPWPHDSYYLFHDFIQQL